MREPSPCARAARTGFFVMYAHLLSDFSDIFERQ